MLKTFRVGLAVLCFVGLCLLFVDVSGLAAERLSFLASMQLVPAMLAGSLLVVAGLMVFTLLFGRLYCSAVCPLGVLQDGISRLNRGRRYRFRPDRPWLRLASLALFILALATGLPLLFGLLEPYSAFGRIAADILAPAWATASNVLAVVAERMDSFALGVSPVWQKGAAALGSAIVTLAVIGVLAWRSGRTWCNSLCPVGALLGQLNRAAILRPRLDPAVCLRCGRCERACKAGCIDAGQALLDAGRCVSCFNCLSTCRKGAISYRPGIGSKGVAAAGGQALAAGEKKQTSGPVPDGSDGASGSVSKGSRIAQSAAVHPVATAAPVKGAAGTVPRQRQENTEPGTVAAFAAPRKSTATGRRAFFSAMGIALGGAVAAPLSALATAREEEIPALTRKRPSERAVPVLPPGAGGLASFTARCTGCQLCVSACPNQVLRAGDAGGRALQPVMGFERGYCRVNCVRCSSVCPAGAIRPVSVEEKSVIQIGRAVVDPQACIVTTDNVACTACSRACPAGAVNMVDGNGPHARPAVDAERCIGCGACEYHCPARPLAAIRVEGNLEHRRV